MARRCSDGKVDLWVRWIKGSRLSLFVRVFSQAALFSRARATTTPVALVAGLILDESTRFSGGRGMKFSQVVVSARSRTQVLIKSARDRFCGFRWADRIRTTDMNTVPRFRCRKTYLYAQMGVIAWKAAIPGPVSQPDEQTKLNAQYSRLSSG